ncbi:mercuric transporter MerT family protein [Massilia phyllosphaerae]|uniref:mercuric transporter MerT family protein n=1 Tax=Massilia phyllosphaerae TaxID=3106034 RepID=UPI002B1CDF70|nr:mercuric transporter MerT family protein [Massilia sp. SGZ-792]
MSRPDPVTVSNSAAGSERKAGRLVALAVVASLLASTCCVLPLVLVLVGITGAWMSMLVAMKPVTPYAIAVCIGALGWAGWLLFKPAAACDIEDGSCATTRPVVRRVFVVCALLIALLLSFPKFAPLFY